MKHIRSRYLLGIVILLFPILLKSQDIPTEVSIQVGPETGVSVFLPKCSYRENGQGVYFGGFVSVSMFGVFGFSLGPLVGYRHKVLAVESSLSWSYISVTDHDKGEKFSVNRLTLNPTLMLGYKKAFAGFGPSFYLIKPKRMSNSFLDPIGKYNFELGYSNRGWEN